jgi:hypothetical protein
VSTYKEFIEAFEIFAKYNSDEYPLCAEHDEIYAWVDDDKVSEEDKKRLDELGWIINSDGGFKKFV